ncbi:BTB/POZ and MATH domain-containing protein 2 [Brachypodium distachyon]|uniref:BTB domain-containing protein n=1 Tax=Brachypodium distachyon TaxID=15368 RepID=A0A0Q3KX38_BRADI|nr:BTB/POZ and MATH domain-containing protein 2 [Brachypodium distachyon]KQJ84725.1 hypothetical protein BRADI_5g22446v3 [Brachypodium distachyon]|eukprot:XP_003579327.1 BTB/POZ and MATH domain-containing protein 2 [Brachypodium distachyon]
MASSSTSPEPETTSTRCITATLDFEMANYLELRGMGVGNFVCSRTFRVGGYDWEIRFYPDGWKENNCHGKAACFLCYLSEAKDVRARVKLSLLEKDRPDDAPIASFDATEHVFSPDRSEIWGHTDFASKYELKSLSRPLPGRPDAGCFTARCVLTVRKDSPPLELLGHLERMLGEGAGADVTFRVGRRRFPAHRALLAARSPVFRAQLFGAMAEKDMARVKVVDMDPGIFGMMLHYLYTDSLPAPCGAGDEEGGGGYSAAEMQHLLVAADRYGLERLKLMCEEELCEKIDVETVATTLALANQHRCKLLKDACLVFMSSPEVLGVVLEAEGFREHFLTTCRPLTLEGRDKGKKASGGEEEIGQSPKVKRIRTKYQD